MVYVLAPGTDPPRALAREVRTGLDSEKEVQILSGLGLAERVIVEGNAFLEDGQAVRPAGSP